METSTIAAPPVPLARLVVHLSPFADRMFKAIQRLTNECEAHPCGGFTTDDMQWQMGLAFTPDEMLWAALDELTESRLIRHCGDDDEDAIGTCYEILHNDTAHTQKGRERGPDSTQN